MRRFLLVSFVALALTHGANAKAPNVVLVLADDMGIGDVSSFFPDRLRTPNIDALARNGVAFLQARAAASVCTPSRYSLLTGRHMKGTWLDHGVLKPYGTSLIKPGAWTLPQMMAWGGYNTAMVGKNHVGIDWQTKSGVATGPKATRDWRGLALEQPYLNGPLDWGFHSYFGVDAPNYPPYAFIRGRHVQGVLNFWSGSGPDGIDGLAVRNWNVNTVYGRIENEAITTIGALAAKPRPFFLFVSLTGPHTPITPAPQFVGRSGIGPYGDYVLTVDATVGKITRALKARGVYRNTIIVFASDNGSPARVSDDAPPTSLLRVHRSNGPTRGIKASPYEGGLRVPLIVSWPAEGTIGRTNRVVGLIDLPATLADLIGHPLRSRQAAPESVSFAGSVVPGTPERGSRFGIRGHYGQSMRGLDTVRVGCFKLIQRQGEPPEANAVCRGEAGELSDLAAMHPRLTETLQRVLAQHLQRMR